MNARNAPDWLTAWEYAHRGLHGSGVPENSLGAAQAAIDAGLGIECDIQFSRDGVPMVFHDYTLARLTGADGDFAQRPAGEIMKIVLTGSDQVIPPLGLWLDRVNGQVPVLIEVKAFDHAHLAARCSSLMAALASYTGPFAIMSFDPAIPRWIADHSPQTLHGLVMREDHHGDTQTHQERVDALEQSRAQFLAFHIAALPNPWVAGLREGGLPILTWTVNSRATRARAQNHADALIAEGAGLE